MATAPFAGTENALKCANGPAGGAVQASAGEVVVAVNAQQAMAMLATRVRRRVGVMDGISEALPPQAGAHSKSCACRFMRKIAAGAERRPDAAAMLCQISPVPWHPCVPACPRADDRAGGR